MVSPPLILESIALSSTFIGSPFLIVAVTSNLCMDNAKKNASSDRLMLSVTMQEDARQQFF